MSDIAQSSTDIATLSAPARTAWTLNYLGRDSRLYDSARIAGFDRFTGVAIAAMFAFTFAGAAARHIRIGFDGCEGIFALVGFFALLGLFYTFVRPEPKIALFSRTLIEFFLFPILGVVFTYVGAAWGGRDMTWLAAGFDRAIGIDWPQQWLLLKHNPGLDTFMRLVYGSLGVQFVLLPLWFMARGHFGHSRVLMNCFVLGIAATMAIAAIFPVEDAVAWHRLVPIDAHGYTGEPRVDHYLALRDGTLVDIEFRDMWGIICFPSFHVVASFLFVAMASFDRLARWPIFLLNVLMMAAVPRWGGHHVADVVGGLILGAALLAAALRYTMITPAAPLLTPWKGRVRVG